jgi:antitoxin HicB
MQIIQPLQLNNMENNLKYRVVIQWSEEDNCYLVALPDFPTKTQIWATHGDTYEEALKHGLEVMEELILIAQDEGKPLPGIPQSALN